MPISAERNIRMEQTKQMQGAIWIHLGVMLLCGVIVLLMFLLGLQDGLAVTERCNCSWGKVVGFTIGSMLIVITQLFTYLPYFNSCKRMIRKDTRAKERFRKRIPAKMLLLVLMPFLAGMVLVYLLLPLLIDQNGNLLWVFQHGAGIGAICVTSIMTLASGLLLKLGCTPQF